MARPKASAAADSRRRVLTAAAAEFAGRGYAGANMDRIARAARLNKAMIYYHFKSKAALYREILRDMFEAVRDDVAQVAAAPIEPDEKIRRYVEVIATAAAARPHFPPIWLREVAEGGEHVDAATLDYLRGVLGSLDRIITDGRRAGRFQAVPAMMLHAGIIAPLMFFLATAPLRRKIQRHVTAGPLSLSRDVVIAQIQRVALAQLEGKI